MLKQLLGELADEGLIAKRRKRLRRRAELRPVMVLEVAGNDESGELYAVPVYQPGYRVSERQASFSPDNREENQWLVLCQRYPQPPEYTFLLPKNEYLEPP